MFEQVVHNVELSKPSKASADLHFQEWKWTAAVLCLVDVVAVELALLLGYLTREALTIWWPIDLEPSVYVGFIGGILVLPLAYAAVGLYPGYGLGDIERLRRRISVTFFVFVILIAWDNIAQVGAWSRGIMLATSAFALVLTPLCESLARSYLVHWRLWGVPVLLIGTSETGAMLARILKSERRLGLVPTGFLSADSKVRTDTMEGLPILGSVSDAAKYKDQVETAILAMPNAGKNRLSQLSQNLPFSRIIVVPDLFDLPSLWVTPRDLGGVLALELRQNLLIRRNRIIKRASDYVMAVPLFLLSLPIIAVAALCIKLASPGPAFFFQEREGLGGRKFRMIKLRTMYPDAEARLKEFQEQDSAARREWQSHAKLTNDPRIISGIGRCLRETSIDELPQLWNVLRGDMSLIGPRPFVDYHLVLFSDEFRAFRSKVRPGITGLWQVLARNNGDIAAQETLDTYYTRNWSLWFDLYVLIHTIPAVLSRRGAR